MSEKIETVVDATTTTEVDKTVTETTEQKPPVEEAKVNTEAATKTATEVKVESKESKREPEKLELKNPEGSPLSAERVEAIANLAKEQGLSSKQAQAFLDREAADKKAEAEALETMKDTWLKESAADKEFGGEKLKENSELGKRALTAFATPELIAKVEASGLGSHPEFFKMLAKIGRAMGEDKLGDGGNQPAGDAPKSREEKWYGKKAT